MAYTRKPIADLWTTLNSAENCTSLLKKHLTEDIYLDLRDKTTQQGGDIGQCIQSGCMNLDSLVGLYACDPDAYDVYSPLFDPVIKDYHGVSEVQHPASDWGDDDDILKLGNLDEGEMIISTRVRVGRNQKNMPFPLTVTAKERKEIEKKTAEVLNGLPGDLKGEYQSLSSMAEDTQQRLINDHFLFKKTGKFLREAGGHRDWPDGRGIFISSNNKFIVWINEGDHMRFISMQKGSNLGEVYKRLKDAYNILEKKLQFSYSKKLGFLSHCPTNLGNTLRASVHIAIPNLHSEQETLREISEEYNLQLRGIDGEHTESVSGVYDISNRRRLGLTEWQAVQEMKTGVMEIILAEKNLGKT